MNVTIKTPEEQEKMRVAGRLAADVLDMIGAHVRAGITTDELDRICHDYIVGEQKAIPAPLNYRGFPKSICTSVNHVVCHGIPGDKKLKTGDIVNIDVTVIKDEFHGDSSRMFTIGEPSVIAERLMRVCRESMWHGIRLIKAGTRLGDIGHAVQRHAEEHRFSVVREYCGHGIGRGFHEDPQVLHYGKPGTGPELVPGMTITVEPMLNAGRREVKLLSDGWTVVTKDHSLSAQWEHTVLVTETGFEVLTLGAEDRAAGLGAEGRAAEPGAGNRAAGLGAEGRAAEVGAGGRAAEGPAAGLAARLRAEDDARRRDEGRGPAHEGQGAAAGDRSALRSG